MLDNLRQDIARLGALRKKPVWRITIESLLFDNGFLAVVLYRLASWFKHRRWPFLGPFFGRLQQLLTGVEIAPGAHIGPGLIISHGQGIVIGQWTRVGRDVTLLHQVTLGAAGDHSIEQMPRVGDRVFIGAGAKVIGDIEIGDDAMIGVNAVITRDVPAGHRALAKGGLHIVARKDLS